MPRPKPQRAIGGEANLAQRIVRELAYRGWSPAELARRMTEAGCSIGTSSVYKILDETKPRTISVDEFICLSRVFETTTDDLLTPVAALDNKRAKELLSELDGADERMFTGVMQAVEAHVKLFALRAESPELWDYVVNHHYNPGKPSRSESSLLTVVRDDGARVAVNDDVMKEALSTLNEAIIRLSAAAFEAGAEYDETQ